MNRKWDLSYFKEKKQWFDRKLHNIFSDGYKITSGKNIDYDRLSEIGNK